MAKEVQLDDKALDLKLYKQICWGLGAPECEIWATKPENLTLYVRFCITYMARKVQIDNEADLMPYTISFRIVGIPKSQI